MQSVLASSLHVYLVFPQHPFVCSPHVQDSCLYVMCIRPLHMRLLPSSAYLQQQKIKLLCYFLHSTFRCLVSIISQCISFCLIIPWFYCKILFIKSRQKVFIKFPGKKFQLMFLNNSLPGFSMGIVLPKTLISIFPTLWILMTITCCYLAFSLLFSTHKYIFIGNFSFGELNRITYLLHHV